MDWQSWALVFIAATMVVMAVSSVVRKLSATKAPVATAVNMPAESPVGEIETRLTPASVATPGETIMPPPKTAEDGTQNSAALALKQLDYETFKKMQTEAIEALRKRVREKGPEAAGMTEEDLDRMLKEDKFPQ